MPACILTAAALLLVASPARASVVKIVWHEQGAFQHVAEIEPGGVAEVCGAISGQEQIHWAFEASAALDFNIHYHVGEDVVFPAKFPDTVDRSGILLTPVDQDYCWMWTSHLSAPATVTLRLSH